MVVTVAYVRQQLSNLAHSGGSHKDQAEKYVECNQAPIQLYTHGELFLFRYRATLDSILLSSGEELVDALKTFIEASTLFLSRWHFTLADTKETSSGIYKIFRNIAGFNTPQTGYKRIAEPSEWSPASQILAICQQIVGKFD